MSARPHVILAVFKRNFLSYFSGVIGYLFIVAFVAAGAFLSFGPRFFANNLANLDQLNEWFPWLLLFFVPAITMTAWADERKLGTDELLFTLPASDVQILLGKYFAVLAIYTVALLFSLVFSSVGVLGYLTTTSSEFMDFDKGLILANYVGYWFAGAALLSAGMVASILTSSATVAYIIGAVFCAIPVFIGEVAPANRLLSSLSLSEQLRDFGLGMIPLSAVFYFISLTLFMLYLNMVFISKRHWSGGPHGVPMGLHFVVRAVSLAAILIGVNVVAANASVPLDLTSERLYSVDQTTRQTLASVKSERPVFIQAFISPEVPGEYVATRSNLIGMLRQYDRIGGDRVKVRIVETEQFSDAAEEARKFGIEARQVQTEQGGKTFTETIYMGAVVSSGADDEVVIPFFDVGTPVQYELTRSVQTIAKNERLKIGVLDTDARMFGGFDPMTFSSNPPWRIVTELKKQYEVEQVSPDTPIEGDYDVLLVGMPSSLTDPQMDNLVKYVTSGRPTLIFDDPLPVFSRGLSLAPRQPKPSHGGMFGQQQPPIPKADDGRATRLVNALGIAWDNGEVVWDSYNPHPEFADVVRPELVFVGTGSGAKSAFSSKSEITSGLQELLLLFSGVILPRDGNKHLEFTPLLRTSPVSGLLTWEELVEQTPSFFGMGGPRIRNDVPRITDSVEHVVAAHIKSKSGSKDSPALNVVYVADLDMISDTMFNVRDRELYGLKLDNVTFVLNAVDILAGDDSLVPLRKRRARHRTLSKVEELTEQYVEARNEAKREADEEARKELELARQRFAEKRKEIENDSKLDPTTKRIMLSAIQEEESRRLEVAEANIENAKQRKIEASRSDSKRQIRRIESRIQILAVLLTPIPALLLGMIVLSSRMAAERRNIVPERQVKR